jgi:hypothetical protein
MRAFKSARTVGAREERDFDLSLYRINTYFWRWNNRNLNCRHISLCKRTLKLALE